MDDDPDPYLKQMKTFLETLKVPVKSDDEAAQLIAEDVSVSKITRLMRLTTRKRWVLLPVFGE